MLNRFKTILNGNMIIVFGEMLIEKINAALRERRDCIYFFKLL